MNIFESVKKGIAYIESNLHRETGVRDVADFVAYSQFYFSREFSRHAHISVYDYIIKRKISESYKQLFREKGRIADLAFAYGFQSHEVYTRAFKKIFGETPSEAAVYKPLAIFEAIDERYLEFLHALRVEEIGLPCQNCFFEIEKPAGSGPESCRLVLLSKTNLLKIETVFQGGLTADESPYISFNLKGAKKIVRIHHTDIALCLRYFTEHYYDASIMRGNFILLNQKNGCTEVAVPVTGPDSPAP